MAGSQRDGQGLRQSRSAPPDCCCPTGKRGRRISDNDPSALGLGCRSVAAGDGIVQKPGVLPTFTVTVAGFAASWWLGDRQRTAAGRRALISVEISRGERHWPLPLLIAGCKVAVPEQESSGRLG